MDDYFTYSTIIAISLNVSGVKLFTDLPNETIVSSFFFTLSLAALADKIFRSYMPKNLPSIVQMVISMILSLYSFEMLQATFWIPLERSCYNMATAVDLWASRFCAVDKGPTICTTEAVANFLAKSGIIPVVLAITFLVGILHTIQAPYAAFLWRPRKKPWKPMRPPTPYPTAVEDNHLAEESSSTLSQNESIENLDNLPLPEESSVPPHEDFEELDHLFPPGSVSACLKARAVASVKAAVEAVIGEMNMDSDEN